MTDHPHEDDPTGGSRDIETDIEKDAVWDLLLEARKTEVGPYFARNILREIRQLEESGSTGVLAGLKSLFTFPRIAFAVSAVIALAVILFQTAGERDMDIVDTTAAPPTETLVATLDSTASDSSDPSDSSDSSDPSEFDIGDYQEEIQMIDYLDGLLAVQNVEALDDEALAEILF